MTNPVFFPCAQTPSLQDIIEVTGAKLREGHDPTLNVTGIASIERAGAGDLVYMDNPKYVDALKQTSAAACFVGPRFAAHVPAATAALIVPDPYRAFAHVLGLMYPEALKPQSVFRETGISPGSFVHPSARLEPGVIVDPGAVVGAGAEIGAGTVLGANCVIGPEVRIGRNGSIGANVTIVAGLIGNRVILHPGVRIGQDGFGFAMGMKGHAKVPQIGRVIIQDDVEVGANTTIDRGASRDTVIGEGTKIDNLVQIGHNVVIGRHCVIVSQVGISGSVTIGDFVAIGGQVGIVGHITIGEGAQIAASSNVAGDVPPGARWGGTPAKPVKEWFREMTTLKKLASRNDSVKNDAHPQ